MLGTNHSSSSEYFQPDVDLSVGNVFNGLKATYVHFPSRFTRQYNFAMYTRCIHDYTKASTVLYISYPA